MRTQGHPNKADRIDNWQPQRCIVPVDNTIQHELAKARFIAHVLMDQMLGHLVDWRGGVYFEATQY